MPVPGNPSDSESRPANVLQNNYHRPSFPWVCGNASVGEPCWTGPTVAGDCGCRAECYPVARGGGWACSRPLHRGGTCSEGPTEAGRCCHERPPCVPRRSLRSQRQRVSFAMFCMMLGIGLIVYGSGRTYEVIAPGPLSSPHAERMAHQGDDRCASCHSQAHQSLGQWVGGLMGNTTSSKTVTKTDLCLKCHQRDLCGEYATFAHNVAPAVLSEINNLRNGSEKNKTNHAPIHQVSGRMVFGSIFKNGQPIACATCHREHHGQEIDMKAMTDQQCQSCHGQIFHSFELDHPEFKHWPAVARQGIRFDHNTHHFMHFPQGNRPFECTQCHRDDRQGNVQQLVGFDQACGACHQGAMDLSFAGGLALLQLPSLDVAALRSSQQDIGQWPQELSASFDGRLSALSEVLLRADSDAAIGLTVLGPGFDFLDLDANDPAQAKAAGQVAWGIKRLIADLSLRGHEAIRQRLQIVLEQTIDDHSLARLTQNFSPTLARDSARLWFPQLWNEVTADQVAPKATLRTDLQAAAIKNNSDVHRLVLPNDVLARILFPERVSQDKSQELLMENPLAGVYGQGVESPNDRLSATSPQLSPSPQTNQADQADQTDQSPLATTPNLLARNPLADYGNGSSPSHETREPAPSAIDSVSPGDVQSPTSPVLPPARNPESLVTQNPLPDNGPALALPAPEASHAGRAKAVGWVRDDTNFSLNYHVSGHADLWMKEWIDLLIKRRTAGMEQDWLTYAVGVMVAPERGGNCLQCHGDQVGSNLEPQVNWTARYRDPAVKEWTKFNHRPHTLLPGLSDCRSCHQLREQSAGQGNSLAIVPGPMEKGVGNIHLAGFSRDNSHPVQGHDEKSPVRLTGHRSDFHALTKSQCASCHQAGSTRNSCTTCHNYHIGQRVQQ